MMKKILLALMITGLCLMPSAAISESEQNSDELLKQKIVGSWCKGETPYGVTTFKEDGGYEGKIYMSPERSELLMEIEGEWWIEDGKLYNKLTKTEPETAVQSGMTIVDTIIGISDNKLALMDRKGKKYVKSRTK
ncbi:MAG TPA: hypothetical protein DDW45_07285 [Gammaproteobacteria bacterium]|nr:hypothetical protein [Gammaproteobacteria bacterium]